MVGRTNLWFASTSRKAVLNAWKTGMGLGVVLRSRARSNGNKAVRIMIVTEACFATDPGKVSMSSLGASSCWTSKRTRT